MKINLSFLNLLTVLFIGLKLAKQIDWSWWWVLSPTLFQVGVGLLILVVFLLLGLIAAVVRALKL